MNASALSLAALSLAAVSLLAAGCDRGRDADYPQPGDPNYQQPNGQGPQNPQQPGQYPQQPGQPPGQYPQQNPGQYQQPAQQAPVSPLAIPCQSDLICGVNKCNTQTQHCAFPCASNNDCANGFSCMGAGGPTALCLPGNLGGQPQQPQQAQPQQPPR